MPPKAHKTIFHTTEKSNFILNMTNDQFNRFASVSTSIGIILIFVFSCISELMSHSEKKLENDWRIYPSVGLAATGLIGISIFIIALIKQTLTKKQIAASVTALLMMIFLYVSYINAFTDIEDYSAFIGYRYSRYEGMMTYLSLIFIFAGAMSLNRREAVKKIMDTISVTALLECIWSALQMIPDFPNHYHKMPYLIENVSLPSGVAGSPVSLSVLLTAGLSVSAAGSIYDISKKRKILYGITSFASAFFMVWTHTAAGIVSAALILIILLAVTLAGKKKAETKPSFIPFILIIAGGLAALTAMLLSTGVRLLDGAIIWHDGCYRLNSFGQHTNDGAPLFDLPAFYSYLWSEALTIINKYPLTGIGPDSFVIPFIEQGIFASVTANKADRPFNSFLYYAATFGIPYCISYAAVLVLSAVFAVRSAVKFLKEKDNWIHTAVLAGTLSYIVISFITNDTAASAPFIWLLLGLSCSTLSSEK